MKLIIFVYLLMVVTATTVSAQQYERYKKLTDTTLVSNHLGFEKSISVTVPIEWQRGIDKDFPLVIIFDRQNSRSHDYIIRTIDYLTSNEQMPSCVIVSVESTQEFRYRETQYKVSDDRGMAAENERFVFEELIPLAERSYRASAFRLLIGHSRYGYFTTSLLASRTQDVNAVISLSPFFDQKNVSLTDSVVAAVAQPMERPLYYRFSIGNDFPDDFAKMDAALKSIENPRFDAKGHLFPEADHNVTPGLTIGGALYDVFEKWSGIQANYISNDQQDVGIIDDLERDMLNAYGEPLAFSLGNLNGKGWYFYNLGQFAEAARAWKLLIERYPNFSEAYLYIIDAKNILKQDATSEKARFLKSIAESELYTAEEKRELMAEFERMK